MKKVLLSVMVVYMSVVVGCATAKVIKPEYTVKPIPGKGLCHRVTIFDIDGKPLDGWVTIETYSKMTQPRKVMPRPMPVGK